MFSLADGLVLRPLPVPRADQVVSVSATAPRATRRSSSNNNRTLVISTTSTCATARKASLVWRPTASRSRASPIGARPDRAEQARPRESAATSSTCSNSSLRSDAPSVPTRTACLDETRSSCSPTRRGPSSSDPILASSGGRSASVVSTSPSSAWRRQSFTGMHLALPPAFYHSHRDVVEARRRSARHAARTAQASAILEVRGRIKPGVSLEQARQEVASIARGLEQTYPDTNRNYGMLVKTAFDARLDERVAVGTDSVHAPDAGVRRSARGVRQRGRPAHEPCSRARERDGAATGDRRRPLPHHAANDHGKCSARRRRRCARTRDGLRRRAVASPSCRSSATSVCV